MFLLYKLINPNQNLTQSIGNSVTNWHTVTSPEEVSILFIEPTHLLQSKTVPDGQIQVKDNLEVIGDQFYSPIL